MYIWFGILIAADHKARMDVKVSNPSAIHLAQNRFHGGRGGASPLAGKIESLLWFAH